ECDRIVTELVAVLFPGAGSATPGGAAIEEVLISVPDADALTSPDAVNVALPPWTSVTIVEIDPTPFAAAHADPGVAVHVHEAPVNGDGNVLVTVASVTSAGPALLTPMAHTSVAPGSTVVAPGVIVAARSAMSEAVSTTDIASLAVLGSAGALVCSAATFVTLPG